MSRSARDRSIMTAVLHPPCHTLTSQHHQMTNKQISSVDPHTCTDQGHLLLIEGKAATIRSMHLKLSCRIVKCRSLNQLCTQFPVYCSQNPVLILTALTGEADHLTSDCRQAAHYETSRLLKYRRKNKLLTKVTIMKYPHWSKIDLYKIFIGNI